ncbi:hypothetical protein AAHH97_16050 [Mycolicibacterium elephantis]|uniref:hypothetical protein n=1 Tax=Mycolicibacterium elephantis TaxID=81858 RepID=UPI000A052B69
MACVDDDGESSATAGDALAMAPPPAAASTPLVKAAAVTSDFLFLACFERLCLAIGAVDPFAL